MLIKQGDAQILDIITDEDIDNEKTDKVMKAAKEAAKNVTKDGNKNSFRKEAE